MARLALALSSALTFTLAIPGCGGGGGSPTAPAANEAPATIAPPTGAPAWGPIGVGLEGLGGRGLEFVDVAKTLRPFEAIGGGSVPTDAVGWPLADAKTVFFDHRPFGTWLPEGPDDPDKYQVDVSGTYKLTCSGRADVTNEGGTFEVQNLRFDGRATHADIVVPRGQALVVVGFRNTNGGVRDLRLVRPGYSEDARETFHRPFLAALVPFSVLRFMDWTHTNDSDAPYPATTRWADRKLPSDATQEPFGAKLDGAAWEHVVDLCNAAGKDCWINVPVSADDDYVRELARLLRSRLDGSRRLYLEHSNEVWNSLFSQYQWNRQAALGEVAAGGSSLADDGRSDDDTVLRRRHARRTYEIARIFASVFGEPAINQRIRPVMSWWVIQPAQYRDQLEWLRRTYGPPQQYLYAIAGAPYFNSQGAGPSASPQQILAAMAASSDASRATRQQLSQLAAEFGLRHFCYEGGPDSGGGSATKVGNRIRAHRDAAMQGLVTRDLAHNWYPLGGSLFMYFTLTSSYGRHGMWGATDDVTNLDTPKYRALAQAAANAPPGP